MLQARNRVLQKTSVADANTGERTGAESGNKANNQRRKSTLNNFTRRSSLKSPQKPTGYLYDPRARPVKYAEEISNMTSGTLCERAVTSLFERMTVSIVENLSQIRFRK